MWGRGGALSSAAFWLKTNEITSVVVYCRLVLF